MGRSDHLHLHYMAAIARDATDPWARNFAASIMRQARNPKWEPSPKQRGIARRLVEDFFKADLIVVEDGHE